MKSKITIALLVLATCHLARSAGKATTAKPKPTQKPTTTAKPAAKSAGQPAPAAGQKPGGGGSGGGGGPQVKVSDLPIVHGSAVEMGGGGSIDSFIRHVDQQIAAGNTAPKGAAPPRAQPPPQDDWIEPANAGPSARSGQGPAQGFGPASRSAPMSQFQSQSYDMYYQPRQGKALLRPDGWIESRPGDVIDIPLQTASPDIPKEIIEYFEKSRQTDLKLVAAIQRAENNEGRRALEREKKRYDQEWRRKNLAHDTHDANQNHAEEFISKSIHKNLKNDFNNDLEDWAREERQKLKAQHEKQATNFKASDSAPKPSGAGQPAARSSGQAPKANNPAPKPNQPAARSNATTPKPKPKPKGK